MHPRNDLLGFLSGAVFGLSPFGKLVPSMSLLQIISPQIDYSGTEVLAKVSIAILVAFFGGMAGVAGKDLYASIKKRFKK